MDHPQSRLRFQLFYFGLACATIGVGLWVHWYAKMIPPMPRDVLGDALWAGMIMWWVGVAAPAARVWPRALVALAVCYTVELSQLYHGSTVDAARATSLGHLVLGSGFEPRDFASYALGVLTSVPVDRAARSVIQRYPLP